MYVFGELYNLSFSVTGLHLLLMHNILTLFWATQSLMNNNKMYQLKFFIQVPKNSGVHIGDSWNRFIIGGLTLKIVGYGFAYDITYRTTLFMNVIFVSSQKAGFYVPRQHWLNRFSCRFLKSFLYVSLVFFIIHVTFHRHNNIEPL